jgi:xylulokinase
MLLWLREQKAAEFTRLRHWAGVAELVGLDLTGELATNASLACRTMAFDVTKRHWVADLLAFASLESDEMPRVLPLGRSVGGLTAAAAARLGLPSGTPVAIAGHDHLAAALGAGVTKPGAALDSMGSAEATLLVTQGPALAEAVRRGGFSTGCHAVDGLAYVVGGLQSSGALIEWFMATFLAERPGASVKPPGDEAGLTGTETERYGRFIELLDLAVPGPVEPVVLPYLRGRTAPHRDPSATLEIEGVRENHTLVDLAAAVVDGAAYHVRWMLDELSRVTETPLDRIKLTGGGARNRRWVAAKAALGPGRLEVVRTEEAAAYGASLVAGVASGVYGSVAEALAVASPFDRVSAPATIRARYDAAYLDRWLPTVMTRLRQSGI